MKNFAPPASRFSPVLVESGGVVKAFNAKGLADLTQGELKHLEETAKSLGAKGWLYQIRERRVEIPHSQIPFR